MSETPQTNIHFSVNKCAKKTSRTIMNLSSDITLKEVTHPLSSQSSDFSLWTQPVPFSFDEWKTILTEWTTKKSFKLPATSSAAHRQSTSTLKKSDRSSLPRNQVFGDTLVDSFLATPSNHYLQSSLSLNRHDVPKIISNPNRRYVSSFKTVTHATSNKAPSRVSYINDSVLILKLSKDHPSENVDHPIPAANKYSSLSMASSVSIKSAKNGPNASQSFAFPARLSPILKVEGQKRRNLHHDSSMIAAGTEDLVTHPISSHLPMSTSTTSHPPPSNSTFFPYRSTAAAAATTTTNNHRSKGLSSDHPSNSTTTLLIPNDKFKSNMSSSLRPTRPLPSNSLSSQPNPRANLNTNSKTRNQTEKSLPIREVFEYPDPFTNCPAEILSKLAQLTKLQLETIEWEKKKRFTKRKPLNNNSNGTTHGKDSP